MTKEELIVDVAKKSEISEEDARKVIDAFTEQIRSELSHGGKVSISGFGSFVLSSHAAKTFTHPRTGKKMDLPERKLPHFKPSGIFKKNFRK